VSAPAAVAFWPHTTDWQVASARLRCREIVTGLNAAGLATALYQPNDAAPHVLVLSKRYDRESLAHALGLRAAHGTRLVLDLCDNHFHNDHPTPLFIERAQQLAQAVRQVDRVVAASLALADAVRREVPDAPAIDVIGDLVESRLQPPRRWRARVTARWQLLRLRRELRLDGVAVGRRLVWFGNHGSPNVDGGMQDLASIRSALEQHHHAAPLSLTVISNSRERFDAVTQGWPWPCHYLPWSSASFDDALALHDVALIPVRLNRFTACKTANRVATAAVHGLAVAADAIPAYEEFRSCIVLNDWHAGLARLMNDGDLRRASVACVQAVLQAQYAPAIVTARWRAVLESLV